MAVMRKLLRSCFAFSVVPQGVQCVCSHAYCVNAGSREPDSPGVLVELSLSKDVGWMVGGS